MYKFLTSILNAPGNAKAEETKLAARKYAAALRMERVEEDEYQEFLRVSPLGAQVRQYIQSTQLLAESSPPVSSVPSTRADAPEGTSPPALTLSVGSPMSDATASATARLLTKGGDTVLEEILFNYLRQHPLSSSTVDCLERLLSRPRHFVRAPETTAPARTVPDAAALPQMGIVHEGLANVTPSSVHHNARTPAPVVVATPLTAQQSINRGSTSGAGRGAHGGDALPWRLVLLLLHRWYSALSDAAFLETGGAVFAYLETLFSCWCVLLDRQVVPRERLLGVPLFHTCLKATVALLFSAVSTQYCTRRTVEAVPARVAPSSAPSLGTSPEMSGAHYGEDAMADASSLTPPPPFSSPSPAVEDAVAAAPADAFSTLLLCLSLLCLVFGSPVAPFVDPGRADGGAALATRLPLATRRPDETQSMSSPTSTTSNNNDNNNSSGGKAVSGANANTVTAINLLGELLPLLLPFSKGHYNFRGLAPSRQGEQLSTFGMTCLCLILAHAPLTLLEKVEASLTTALVSADSILLARFSAGGDDVPFLIASITAAEHLLASLLRVFPASLCDAMDNAFYFENAANALAHVPEATNTAAAHVPPCVAEQHAYAAALLESATAHGSVGLVAALSRSRLPPVLHLPCAPDAAMLFDAVFGMLRAAHEVLRDTLTFVSAGETGVAQLVARLQRITETIFTAFADVTADKPDTSRPATAPLLCYALIRYAREVLDTYPAYYHTLVDLGLYTIVERESVFVEDPVLAVSTAALVLQRLTDSAVAAPSITCEPRTPDADVGVLLAQIASAIAALRGASAVVPTCQTTAQAYTCRLENGLYVPLLILEAATSASAQLSTTAQSSLIGADGFSRLCALTVVLNERRCQTCRTATLTITDLDTRQEVTCVRVASSVRTVLLTLATVPAAQTALLRDADVSPVFLCFSMPQWRATAGEVVSTLLEYRDPGLSHAAYVQLLRPLAELCWNEILRCCEAVPDAPPNEDAHAAAANTVDDAAAACETTDQRGFASTAVADADEDASGGAQRDAVLLSMLRCFQDALAAVGSDKTTMAGDDVTLAVRALQEVLYQGASGECFLRLVHRISLPWCIAREEGVAQLVHTMTALMRGNAAMRACLFETISARELVGVLRSEWLDGRPGDWSGLVRLVLEMTFEAVLLLPLPLTSSQEATTMSRTAGLPVRSPSQVVVCSPSLIAALLQVALAEVTTTTNVNTDDTTALADTSRVSFQRGLALLLRVLVACTASHQINLYLLANVGCFDALVDILRALVTSTTTTGGGASRPSFTPTPITGLPEADVVASSETVVDMLMTLLKSMACHHVHVREVKHLLRCNLVHAPSAAQRRLMLPFVTDILCASVTAVLASRHRPAHYLSLTRGSGPAGVRAPLPALHDDGYAVSLWVRLEPPMDDASTPGDACESPLQCLFSMQDAQRRVVCALAVEPTTQQLVCVTLDARGQEVCLPLEGPPLPLGRWVHLTLQRRRPFTASSLPDTSGLTGGAPSSSPLPPPPHTLKEIQLYVDGEEHCSVGRAGYTPVSRGAFVLGYAPPTAPAPGTTTTTPLTTFVGQAASVYFFGRVLWDAEVRELYALQDSAYAATSQSRRAESEADAPGRRPTPPVDGPASAGQAEASNNTTNTTNNLGGSAPPAAGSLVFVTSGDMGTETHLAGDALVCMDPRLRENGQLYNLSAMVNGRGKDARFHTYPGTTMCSTTSIVDALSVLGAIYTAVMPLLALLVNPQLPFAPSGVQPLRTDQDANPARHHPVACDHGQPDAAAVVDCRLVALHQLLQLLCELLKVDVILPDFHSSGVFVLTAQVLEEMGPLLDAQVVSQLTTLCVATHGVSATLFESAYTSFFLSPDLLRACRRETQVLWTNAHRIAVSTCADDVRASMRGLGAQLFCVAELIYFLDDAVGDEKGEAEAGQMVVPGSLLRDQLFQLLNALTVEPITVADAVAVMHLVTTASASCGHDRVLCDVLAHTRVLIATRPAILAQYLGRADYAVTLIRLLQSPPSTRVAVRREALLQLLLLTSRSKRTQELMNPNYILSPDVVHVAKDVSMAWLKPIMREWGPPSMGTYLALRCGVVGDFARPGLPTRHEPFHTATVSIVFPPALEPLLGLIKFADSAALKAHALADLACVLQADSQGWRRLVAIHGWYIQVINVYLSEYRSPEDLRSQAASPLQRQLLTSPTGSSRVVPKVSSWGSSLQRAGADGGSDDDDEEERGGLNSDHEDETVRRGHQQTILSCAAAVLAHTLFQALLLENYAADELLYVVNFLESTGADALLTRVLLGIAERYLARLAPTAMNASRPTGQDTPPAAAAAAAASSGAATTSFAASLRANLPWASTPALTAPPHGASHTLSLDGNGLTNLVCFVQTVEGVVFCHAPGANSTTPIASAAREDTAGLGCLLVVSPESAHSDNNGPDHSDREVTHAPQFVLVTSLSHQAQMDLLRLPDGRWPHLPLALKLAELISANSSLLHYGTSTTLGGGGGAASERPLLSRVGGSGAGSSSSAGDDAAGGGSGGGSANTTGPRVARRLAKGGFLRIFARFVCAACQLTLRDGNALDGLFDVLDRYVRLVEGDQGGALSLLRRIVSFDDEPRDHSTVATSMQILYVLNDLLQRRLRADVQEAAPRYAFPNAEIVRAMQGLFVLFKKPFQQTGLFAKSPPEESRAERYAKVPTLQWLTTRFATITTRSQSDVVVEAFAEISSRMDYNVFMDRCQSTGERAQQTSKRVAADVARERGTFKGGLEAVLREVYRARTTVAQNVRSFVNQHPCQSMFGDAEAGELASSTGGAAGGGGDVGTTSASSSFFSLGHASSVLRTLRASTWLRFLTHIKGTLWNLDPAGQSRVKYVRLLRGEQLPLLHRKLGFDKDGTDHRNVTLPAHRPVKPLFAEESQLKASTLRLRGGEAVLLQDPKLNDDADAEEQHAEAAEMANRGQMEGADAVLQLPSTHARLRLQAIQGTDGDGAMRSGRRDKDRHSTGDVDAAPGAEPINAGPVEELSLSTFDELDTPDGRALSPRRSLVSSPGLLSSPSASQSAHHTRQTQPHSSSVAARYGDKTAGAPDDDGLAAASAGAPALLSLPCEMPYLMMCWSATFAIRGTTIVILVDETNTAHNQSVPAEAKPFVIRPHNISFDAVSIEQLAPGRRFRMRRSAMEFWLSDRRSVFVNFRDMEAMRTALSAIYLVATSASARRGSVRALTGFYVYSENPKTEPLRLQLMNEWQNRRITNFEYLLWLNQLAGRTLNDLSQYPVFPWVLADYSSATLDLTNVATFRDLRLPIGACGSEDRRRLVCNRYEEMKEMGDVPSHYFTHYSSPAVALYYLVRLEPFTTLQILLQGGHLDHADRMFHSLQSCFRSVTTSSQDVRELIPEMFYLPELCLNQNHVAYGVKQDGVPMNNLELPLWAHGDPYEFIYHMRRALESDYVSTYLHHWIDLIFGFKQRGKDAIDSLNMFNWHSYEDLDRNRGDSVDQQLLIDSLDNVGQTPIQLFRHPHKARPSRELMDPADSHVVVRPKVVTMRWGCPAVAQTLLLTNGRVVVVSTNGAVASFRYVAAPVYRATKTFHELPPSPLFSSPLSAAVHASAAVSAARAVGDTLLSIVTGPELYSFDVAEEHERRIPPLPLGVIPDWDHATSVSVVGPGPSLGAGTAAGHTSSNNSSGPYAGASSEGGHGACTAQNVVVLSYDTDAFVAIGGLFDNSVVIRPLSGTRRDVRLMAHSGRVTHLAASRDSRYMVSGAEDTTFIVWRCFVASRRSPQLEVELLFAVHGHEQNPSAVEVSATMDLLATASADGVLMLHSLSTGNLDRTLHHPLGHSIDRILVQSNCYVPNLVFASHTDHVIHQFSLNGAALRTLAMPGRITSWSLTPNQHLLVGCAVANRGGLASADGSAGEDTMQAQLQRGGQFVLYVHSFFLDIRKVLPLAIPGVVTSIACHPTDAQVAIAATSQGQLVLLRVATRQHSSF